MSRVIPYIFITVGITCLHSCFLMCHIPSHVPHSMYGVKTTECGIKILEGETDVCYWESLYGRYHFAITLPFEADSSYSLHGQDFTVYKGSKKLKHRAIQYGKDKTESSPLSQNNFLVERGRNEIVLLFNTHRLHSDSIIICMRRSNRQEEDTLAYLLCSSLDLH